MHRFIKVFLILLFSGFFLHQALAEEILTWEDCVKEAAKNHPDLIAAQESIKQSEASKKITANAVASKTLVDIKGTARLAPMSRRLV